ncbi:MAG: hypothetical protein FWH03_08055 [Firmicutes bacterium]|nr:hypothetical protein [Bacillota bacterium]
MINEIPYEQRLKNLKKYLQTAKMDVNKYLIAGVAEGNNISQLLDAEIFYENFYVQSKITSINKALNDIAAGKSSKNLLCLYGRRGNGKSVTVYTLPYRNGCTIKEQTVFDLAGGSSIENNVRVPKKQLIDKFCDFFIKMLRENDTVIMKFQNDATMKEELGNSYTGIVAFIEKFFNVSTKTLDERKVLCETYYNDLNISFFDFLSFFIIFSVYCKQNSKKKIESAVYIFDNMESRNTGTSMTAVCEAYEDFNRKLESFFARTANASFNRFSFIEKLVFILSIRSASDFFKRDIHTTGNSALKYWQEGKNIFAHENIHKQHEFLLKKLKFLKDNNLRKDWYDQGCEIAKIIIPKAIIDDYMDGKKIVVKFKKFAEEKFFPFFNGDFRAAIGKLCDIQTNEKTSFSIMQKLLDKGDNVSISAARTILFNKIYDRLNKEGIFANIGVHPINLESKQETHSLTRVILAYLYWEELQHKRGGFSGVAFSDLYRKFSCSNTDEEITNNLYDLSVFSDNTHGVDNWTYLIEYDPIGQKIDKEYINGCINEIKASASNDDLKRTLEIQKEKIEKKICNFITAQATSRENIENLKAQIGKMITKNKHPATLKTILDQITTGENNVKKLTEQINNEKISLKTLEEEIQNLEKNASANKELKVKLTPAGKNFVSRISKNFEFFNVRINFNSKPLQLKALFEYEDANIKYSDKKTFDSIIEDAGEDGEGFGEHQCTKAYELPLLCVYFAIKCFINGIVSSMSDNCKNSKKPTNPTKIDCVIERSIKIASCGYVMKMQEIFHTISNCLAHINNLLKIRRSDCTIDNADLLRLRFWKNKYVSLKKLAKKIILENFDREIIDKKDTQISAAKLQDKYLKLKKYSDS